ncbi:MAG: phosphopantetheinyl transferase [Chlamydiales bacterium]
MAILIYHSRAWPETTPLPAHWLAALPATKRAELVRSQPARRRESATGLRLLAHGMHALGCTDFELSEVHFEDRTRPRTGRGIDFSISHSKGLVACALNTHEGHPVGLDIERIRPIDASSLDGYLLPRGAERVLTATEIFDLWTRRESVVKAASGAGLARIKEVEYDSDDAPIANFDGRRWHTQRVDLGRDFAAHVTTRIDVSGRYSAPAIRVVSVTLELLNLPAPCASDSPR